jgi:hypothetical protein
MFQTLRRWHPLLALTVTLALGACATTTPGPAPPPDVNRPRAQNDSTRGRFINETRWSLRVYVDVDPERLAEAQALVLGPGESQPWQLALGQHRVIARAHGAEPGEPLKGRFDRTIELDPERGGWFLKFRETDFR